MQRAPLTIARRRAGNTPAAGEADAGNASDEAWRVLDIASRWVTQADAKAGAVLAACGVIGGMLYSVIKDGGYGHRAWVHGAAIVCAALLTGAAAAAATALRPRRGAASAPRSLIYFHHVGKLAPDEQAGYVASLSSLLHSPDLLTEQIGQQVWAVSRVAAVKFAWVNVSAITVFGALSALGVTMLAAVLP